MRKLSLKGIAVGAIADIVLTNIAALPLMFFIIHSLKAANVPHEQMSAAVTEAIMGNPLYFLLSSVTGGICSIIGGYISAKIAKHDEILNGALSSILCVGIGIYAFMGGSGTIPLWRHVILLILSPALAAFGGLLRQRQMDLRGQSGSTSVPQ